jgi:hypothetical protein
MTPVEMIVVFVLLSIIAALVVFLFLRKCTTEEVKTSEIETMYDYTPGVPPPKSIPVTGSMSGMNKWSFLWN